MTLSDTVIASVVAGAVGAITAYLTSRWNLRNERARWEHELEIERAKRQDQQLELRREFALRTAELRVTSPAVADAVAAQQAEAYLIVDEGSTEREKRFLAPGEVLIVGRSRHAGLIVQAREFSLSHFEFDARQSEIHVRDLGSRNGTWVNGRQITGSIALKDGDIVAAAPPESCELRIFFRRIGAPNKALQADPVSPGG